MKRDSTEDFMLWPPLFWRWLSSLDYHEWPVIDCWASASLHLLPTYLTSFFDYYESAHRLWVNPWFSELPNVLHHLQCHNQTAYIVVPHWPQCDEWWPRLWSWSKRHWTFPRFTPAFVAADQLVPAPCPWTFYICLVEPPCKRVRTQTDKAYWQFLSQRGYYPELKLLSSNPLRGYQLHYVGKVLGSHLRTPSAPIKDLPLAPLCPTVLDYQHVLALADSLVFASGRLRHMLAVLTHPPAFVALFPEGSLVHAPGKPSSLSMSQLQAAVSVGVLSIYKGQSSVAAPVLFHPLFPVIKSDLASTRMIMDSTLVNQILPKLWGCSLPKLHHIISTILSWQFALIFDAWSFYYQFRLAPGVAAWFGWRMPSRSTNCGSLTGTLNRLPQGFGPSCSIAQEVSNLLTFKLDAIAYVDNYGMGGTTPAEACATAQIFLQRCAFCNVSLKEVNLEPVQVFEFIGVEYDLTQGKYRLPPSWAADVATFLQRLHDVSLGSLNMPLRICWQAVGCTIWTAWVRQMPLGAHLW